MSSGGYDALFSYSPYISGDSWRASDSIYDVGILFCRDHIVGRLRLHIVTCPTTDTCRLARPYALGWLGVTTTTLTHLRHGHRALHVGTLSPLTPTLLSRQVLNAISPLVFLIPKFGIVLLPGKSPSAFRYGRRDNPHHQRHQSGLAETQC
jgi:hypothetical protein